MRLGRFPSQFHFVAAEQVVESAVVELLVGVVVGQWAVEQQVWLVAVLDLDSSLASHCSSARAYSGLASRANTSSAGRFPNADACCWRFGN